MSQDRTFPIWPFVLSGFVAFAVLLTGVVAWAARATLASALVLAGTLESGQQTHLVQHPHGGVVAQVLVREGDVVRAGDPLIILDTRHQADLLRMAELNVAEHAAQIDRLQAQLAGAAQVTFRATLSSLAGGDVTESLLAREQQFLDTERAALSDRVEQLHLQKQQAQSRIDGLAAQQAAAKQRQSLVAAALADQQQLRTRGLSQAGTLLSLEQEAARLLGRLGELAARVVESQTMLAELDAQADVLHSSFRSDAAERIAVLVPRLRGYEREVLDLRREIALAQIKAQVAGTVQDIGPHHEKAVVAPGETLAAVVPLGGVDHVKAKVAPADVDVVFEGQQVTLRLTALDAQSTPEIAGHLTRISATALPAHGDERPYFEVEIRLDGAGQQALPAHAILTAGMPVEVFISTGSGTPLAFLVKPLTDYFARAMRES